MPNSKHVFALLLCLALFSLSTIAGATEPRGINTNEQNKRSAISCFGAQRATPLPVLSPDSATEVTSGFEFGTFTLFCFENRKQNHTYTAESLFSASAAATDTAAATGSAIKQVSALPPVPWVNNVKVERFIKFFESDGRWYFKKWLERTGAYEERIKKVLREEGLPEGLFYIALIESGLSPTTRSRADAVGMWQFIKPTAKRYGLRVDWWIDERKDPEKSTRAAGRFFKRLYTRYGSWYMAMAGYNGGEGRIRRSIKKYGTANYWVLSKNRRALRRETRNYVPKYLAASLIAKNPEEHGFKDLDYKKNTGYDTARISTPTDLRVIARATGVSVWVIKRLNPELLRMYTPPNYPLYEIKLPNGTANRFWANFTRIPPSQRVTFVEHRLKPGETVSALAYRYGTPVKPILSLNNLKNPRRIRAGTIIMVPVRSSYRGTKRKGRT